MNAAPTISRRLGAKRALVPFLALACLLGVLGGRPAPAEVDVREARPDDRIERAIVAGDVHAYLVDLVVSSELRVQLRADRGGSGDGDDDDESPGKDDPPGAGPLPELVILGPGGGELARAQDSRELRIDIAATGRHRLEVRAGTFEGDYELRIDAKFPSNVSNTITVAGAPTSVPIAVPVGSTVRIELRRESGGAPRVVSIRDATGRLLAPGVHHATPSRLRLNPLPVAVPGGLLLEVDAEGGSGKYELRLHVQEDNSGSGRGRDEHTPGRLVLILAENASAQDVVDEFLAQRGPGYSVDRIEDGFVVIRTPEDDEFDEDDDAMYAKALSGVLTAERDSLAKLPEGSQSNALILGSELGRAELEGQAAMDAIRAAQAHAMSTGATVVVAVVDSGVDASYPLLAGRLLPGRDFVDGDSDPADVENGHGTFVAGLVLGAAPDAQILPVRVLGADGRGNVSAIAAGIEWVTLQSRLPEYAGKRFVINLSLGMLGESEVLGAAVRYALADGIPVVAATGNDGVTTTVDFPASIPGVVAVTATDTTGAPAEFANSGPETLLSAPGDRILGPLPAPKGSAYGQGTSFSTALVSGGVALVLDRHAELTPDQVVLRGGRRARTARGLTRAERRRLGRGRLDLRRLVR